MQVEVISIFPPMFEAIRAYGVTGRAVQAGQLQLRLWNPRDFTTDKHRSVDERPYGGGPGMVMRPEPLKAAIAAARKQTPAAKVLYLSPQGRRLDHAGVVELAARPEMILLAGRYEGVDERVLARDVDEEWSIGDYVLSGGELPAMVMIDAIARQLPGVLGDENSAREDSFVQGLLDCPHYTRPEDFDGMGVPEVLLSGDHSAIARWRLKQALGATWRKRPDLVVESALSATERELLDEYRREFGK
jgi:tRNA (guanine37-N1)-methyltransferase